MADESVQRQRPLRGPWLAVFVALTLAGLFLAINHLFNLRFFVGFVLLENRYLYLLLATFFSSAFLLFPAGKGRGARVPWYDLVLFLAALVCSCYFAWHGERMVREAAEFPGPRFAVGGGVVLWLLLLEGARRTGGLALALILLVFSLYPVYAGWLPGPIAGFSLSFADTIRYQTASVEAVLGIPMRVFGNLLVGFILFGAALHVTGAGRFFTNASMALPGEGGGGAAKVAGGAGGLFGAMWGGAGGGGGAGAPAPTRGGPPVTTAPPRGVGPTPAMKRTGFRPEDAAAVE